MQHLKLGAAHHGPVTAVVLRGKDVHAAIHGRVHTYDANTGSLPRTRTLLPCRVHGLACNEHIALLAWGVDAVGVAVSTVQVVLLPPKPLGERKHRQKKKPHPKASEADEWTH